LQKIIDAKGTVVHGEALRNGHRARRADGKGSMKGNLLNSRRKDTLSLRPVHRDARPALNKILGNEVKVELIEETIESVEIMIDDCYHDYELDIRMEREDDLGGIDILTAMLN
jgi:hypothetical protein